MFMPINQKLEALRSILERHDLSEAAEIAFDELPEPKKRTLQSLASKLGLKVTQVFDGIHGQIVDFSVSGQTAQRWRLATSDFKLIANLKGLRWVEMTPTSLTLGL